MRYCPACLRHVQADVNEQHLDGWESIKQEPLADKLSKLFGEDAA
jgi:hypothetical protein